MIVIPQHHRNIIVIDVPEKYKDYSKFIPRYLSTLRISFVHEGIHDSWDIDNITPEYLNNNKIMFVDLLKNISDSDIINGATKQELVTLLEQNNVDISKNLLILIK